MAVPPFAMGDDGGDPAVASRYCGWVDEFACGGGVVHSGAGWAAGLYYLTGPGCAASAEMGIDTDAAQFALGRAAWAFEPLPAGKPVDGGADGAGRGRHADPHRVSHAECSTAR